MIITQKALPRRTFLRGVGATLALPFLDAMVPAASTVARMATAPARRLGFIYIPNGVNQDQWVPTSTGRSFEFSPILSPLEALREQVLVLSGLAHRQADSFGDGNGDHPRATAVWLSGVHAWERRGRKGPTDIKLGITADQIAARAFGKETPLPSLELALEKPTAIACDTGDCFYSNTISWKPEKVEAKHPGNRAGRAHHGERRIERKRGMEEGRRHAGQQIRDEVDPGP